MASRVERTVRVALIGMLHAPQSILHAIFASLEILLKSCATFQLLSSQKTEERRGMAPQIEAWSCYLVRFCVHDGTEQRSAIQCLERKQNIRNVPSSLAPLDRCLQGIAQLQFLSADCGAVPAP